MSKVVPAGVRVASALVWTAAGCGAFLAVAGFVADRRVVGRTPSLAAFAAYPGQNLGDLVENIRDALWIQIGLAVVATVIAAIGASWVGRPTGNARVAGFAAPIVLIP